MVNEHEAARQRLGGAEGRVMLTANEFRVVQNRRDCYRLYVVTDCNTTPQLREPVPDPARFPRHEVTKDSHSRIETRAPG